MFSAQSRKTERAPNLRGRRFPNKFLKMLLEFGLVPELSGHNTVKEEVPYAKSRLDVLLSNGRKCLIEVKSCTLVKDGVALFPDAPTKRGTRHVRHLSEAV